MYELSCMHTTHTEFSRFSGMDGVGICVVLTVAMNRQMIKIIWVSMSTHSS